MAGGPSYFLRVIGLAGARLMSEKSLLGIQDVRRRLVIARRRLMAAQVTLGLVWTLGLAALLLGFGALVEAALWLGSGARWGFVAVYVLSLVVAFGALVVRPLLRGLGLLPGWEDDVIARLSGRRHPAIGDRLVNLLELSAGRASAAAPALTESAVQLLSREVTPVPFERIEDYRPVRRAAPVAALPLAGVLGALMLLPGFGGSIQRLFTPAVAFLPPAPFALVVEPGHVEVVRGGELKVTVRAVGASQPRAVALHLQREGERRAETVRLLADDDGAFRHVEPQLRVGVRYAAEAEGVTTAWFRARVVQRPVIQELRVVLRPPAYTGLPPQRLAPGMGDFAALPGTTVELSLRAEGPAVDSAALIFGSGARLPLEVRGRQAAGRFAVRQPDTYHVRLTSLEGHANDAPITYAIRTLTDSPPQIRLLEPLEATLTESLVTRVRARVSDDFGFSRAVLFFRLAERERQPVESDFGELPLSIDPNLLDQDIGRDWLLRTTGLDLRPGDAVAFYIEVWDNNAVAGHQSARTPVHLLRFPSLREQFERLDQAEDTARDGLRHLRDEAEQGRRRFQELRNELMRKQEVDWEDRRQLERLMEEQQRLHDQVRRSAENLHDVLDRMRENELVSEETLRLYQELQRVIEEIADPELLEQLRRLQQAMHELNLEQMLQALDRFDFDERAFRERLERALELFERLRTAKELDEAARRAEDLARQKEQLHDETGALQEAGRSGELSPEEQRAEQARLAEQQRQARAAAEALREQLRDIEQRLQEQRGGQQMRQELQQMQQQLQDAAQQMQQNMQQLQEGQLQDAQQGQQQLRQMMQQMQQALQMMGAQMSGRQQQHNIAGLRRALEDVLTLSFEQESLRDRAARQRPESPAIRQNAQQQVELAAGLASVTDSLRALARQIPEMQRAVQQRSGEALRQMAEATENLADRQPGRAAGHQKGAMTSLNELALLLSDLLEQMMGGAAAGGGGMPMQQLLQQLQQMGSDQQQLNQQIQQMLNDLQGQRLSVDQQERLSQLRQQQEALRQQLEELIREGPLDGQSRSELQRIAEAMEEVARRLDEGRIDRQLRERQEHILSRLLEAHDSIHERGQKEEREGTPADPRHDRDAPPELPEREAIDRLRRDLIRALESGYAPDYQELIKRYFELLQQRQESH